MEPLARNINTTFSQVYVQVLQVLLKAFKKFIGMNRKYFIDFFPIKMS